MNTIPVSDCCLVYSHKTDLEQVIKSFCGTAQNVVSDEIFIRTKAYASL